jgi:CrcB protein
MIAWIAFGGLLGTLARYTLQGWVQARAPGGAFPVGTLLVNLSGSFLLGVVVRFALGSTVVSPELRAGLAIGFCGAFTTMSTFSYESMTLLAQGDYWRAAWYIGGSVVGCIAAVMAGAALASRIL